MMNSASSSLYSCPSTAQNDSSPTKCGISPNQVSDDRDCQADTASISGQAGKADEKRQSGRKDPSEESGFDKKLSENFGDAGIGVVSCASISKYFARASHFKHIPGINLAVGLLESHNCAKSYKEKDMLMAASHGGAAAACIGDFMIESSAVSMLAGKLGTNGALVGAATGLGVLGGILGVGVGVVELKEGLTIRKAGGNSRLFTMGALDIGSGVCSAAGAVITSTGMGGPVGTAVGVALIGTSVLYDISGIVVDYFGHKILPRAEKHGDA
jgi:hypothetical protein